MPWELYFERSAARRTGDHDDPLVLRARAALGSTAREIRPAGQPFLLAGDGVFDRRVNGWFRCPQMSACGALTWTKYARSLRIWLNFLDTVGATWERSRPELVEAFKVWRIQDPRNPRRVQPGTVEKDLIAIKLFYDWAAATWGVVSPVSMRRVFVRGVGPVEKIAVSPPAVRDRDVKWFDPGGWDRYRDLGLLGLTAEGVEDPSWRGRNPQRDAAFADGLYRTGLRLTEWATILDVELPYDDPARMFYTCRLADAVAKGGIGRKYWMPRAALIDVLSYVEGERAAAVGRAQAVGRYENVEGLQIVLRSFGKRRLEIRAAGGQRRTVSLDGLTVAERRRLFRLTGAGLEPLAVWLNEDGLPRVPHGWNHTFNTANRRLARMGLAGFAGSAHMARHSFALRWFAVGKLMYARRLAHLSEEETRDFRQEFGSTWELVQMMLGHRSPVTTMNIYLEPFRALEAELLLAHIEGAAAGALIRELFAADPRVLGDPMHEPEGCA